MELLQDDAFSGLPLLQDVDLSDNLLCSFNSRPFPLENSLKTLNLANNLLEDLSRFDIARFPKLHILNLTNNLLQFLPADILQTLQLPNKFHLLADNNPWNCSHPDWSELLVGKLLLAFCTNQTFDYAPQREHLQESLDGAAPACEPPNCYKCSFNFCLLWLFCGVWIGIIVGNLPKLRTLLCVKPTAYADGTTQCDYSVVDQRLMSGILVTRTPKFPTATTRL
uniref:LRRCT domain-containing protein n=1 Tax=Dendroctonus ponderosae TaxID=77166 RepID=A0AAR5Q461_DENPD